MKSNDKKYGALALVDLDGTLLDRSYQLTVLPERLRVALRAAAEAGVLVGISSDSSLERISRFAREHGFAGPIVAERGAVWAPSPDLLDEAQASRPAALGFPRARDIFVSKVREDASARLEVGDINALSRELIGTEVPAGLSRVILVNGERRGSFSFYALAAENGRWALSANLLGEMVGAARAAIAEADAGLLEGLDVDQNDAYGVAIFHLPDTGKSLAVPPLRGLFGDLPLYVVGDSDADRHHVENVAHCAVGNASPSFRSSADFTAEAQVAEGAVECLWWIAGRASRNS